MDQDLRHCTAGLPEGPHRTADGKLNIRDFDIARFQFKLLSRQRRNIHSAGFSASYLPSIRRPERQHRTTSVNFNIVEGLLSLVPAFAQLLPSKLRFFKALQTWFATMICVASNSCEQEGALGTRLDTDRDQGHRGPG